MDKKDIAGLLKGIGTLLEVKGENEFKVRAYYNGARTIEDMDEDIETLIKENRLKDIKGIGKALNEKITEFVNTGELQYYNKLISEMPQAVFDLLRIPGLGPKRVREIYYELGIDSIGELEYACLENRLLNYKGFGEKIQNKILDGIRNINKYSGKFLYSEVYDAAHKVLSFLNGLESVTNCSFTGEIRRKMEVVSSIDIVVSTGDRNKLYNEIRQNNDLFHIDSVDDENYSGTINGIKVNIYISNPDEYTKILFETTGSSQHLNMVYKLAENN